MTPLEELNIELDKMNNTVKLTQQQLDAEYESNGSHKGTTYARYDKIVGVRDGLKLAIKIVKNHGR